MSLTIAQFEAAYHVPQGAPDRLALQRRLDRVVTERLPAAMDGRLPPAAGDADAVYRIRNLQLDLWTDVSVDDETLAQQWSRLILRGVTQALLYGSPRDVVRYDDAAHFVASFLSDVLAGRAFSRWMYAEFAPLRDLPAGAVAAHLLASRPALLVPVARRLLAARQLEALVQRLRREDVTMLWEHGLGFAATPAAVLPPAYVARLRDAWTTPPPLERGAADGVVGRNALRLYLAAAMDRPALAADAALGVLCRHLAWLHRAWNERPAAGLWTALAQGEVASPAAMAPFLDSLGAALPTVRAWLAEVLATAAGRAYLAAILPLVPDVLAPPEAPPMQSPPSKPAETRAEGDEATTPRASAPRRLLSSFAGVALLVPVLRRLGLPEDLGPVGRYQVFLACVGQALQPLAWSDPAVPALAGLDARRADEARTAEVAWPDLAGWPPPPMHLADEAHLGTLPGRDVARLVLQHLARGLRGCEGSSAAYLAEQFINLPGEIVLTEDAVEVHLGRAPLGILLHMAGRDGDQGPVPWLDDRALVIYLPDG